LAAVSRYAQRKPGKCCVEAFDAALRGRLHASYEQLSEALCRHDSCSAGVTPGQRYPVHLPENLLTIRTRTPAWKSLQLQALRGMDRRGFTVSAKCLPSRGRGLDSFPPLNQARFTWREAGGTGRCPAPPANPALRSPTSASPRLVSARRERRIC